MRHVYIPLCFIVFCIPQTFFPMEQYIELIPINPQKKTTINQPTFIVNAKNIVTFIDEVINQQHPQLHPFLNFFTTTPVLTTEEMLSIAHLTHECCKNSATPIPSLFDALYKQNSYFAETINYFSKFARKNLDSVTGNTIDTIGNPEASQPMQQLNSLPPSIKQYTMLCADNEAAFTYTIVLPHAQSVRAFDVCPTTHMAATHSKDKMLYLWDLKTGLCINTLPENDLLTLIQFNADGSLMGTVAHYRTSDNRQESHIKIWDPLVQKLLHTIKQGFSVYHIDFTHGTPHNTLAIFTQENHAHRHKFLTLWAINKQTSPTLLGHTTQLPWAGEHLTDNKLLYKKDYECFVCPNKKSLLHITKRKCHALHLCKQAIENNSNPDTLTNIRCSQTYQQLTKYEKQMVKKQIAEKISPPLSRQRNNQTIALPTLFFAHSI